MAPHVSGGYEPLWPEHKQSLTELMWRARDIALQIPSTKRLMLAQIKHLAFYWTTSAFCPTRQVVVPDAIKVDVRYLRHTAAAHQTLDSTDPTNTQKKLRHEHAVPRSKLAKYVLAEAKTVDDIIATFDRHCIGVLVTVDEDSKLNSGGLRDGMPPGWQWSDDPLARYATRGFQVFGPMTEPPCFCRAVPI